ncbi:hypothetical protein AQJ43_03215 [Streptomyces avermitilis]|uniref:Membrane protein n=1 Tax=Streptomyces avermitilis (strain ATCC 31267 / DSM 46492 / JCM 5070 / NBRC 14893 / NCIMB 12804 / NRRL 8165 / MA-4680) TaxID=227882 RepID=Q82HS1_STRAW|nr:MULTISPECIES: DUF2690 domain-containing protein [Streptomyces]KUN56618.1 hypothetical protein AQJ43_03215 [Streptomyces avermitilis]MYS99034.1 DUF2690 domain-containing protein [Streptomyces sp. SID5469]OOV32658.1 hypothetical protein SM007_07560 [Streptomyces avermitilis]BAC71149.1 putative membrane protein [Streptomyces avermitilis MA-4680 = NBRC 14893]
MPRWKALPDELDPQVREFASQLRRLVDRSGLSIAAVADRTGYSKTSWERYLNGRLLAPKGAIVALAEVTGTNPIHLTTMWELAERAWSRSEMRHDMTMEAIRISQARAALGESGAPPAAGRNGKAARGATVLPGVAGPAGVSPTIPPQPTAPDVQDSSGEARRGALRGGSSGGSSGASAASSGGNSWGLAGYAGPAQADGRAPAAPTGRSGSPEKGGPRSPGGPGRTPEAAAHGAPGGQPPRDSGPPAVGSPDGARRKRRLTMFLAGVVGALVVIAAAVFLTNNGGDKDNETAPKSPAASASADPDLPAGVKCSGKSCTGKDPENMGCGGELAKTSNSVTVGTTLVEVRYSKTCGAAWARITRAVPGDEVTVASGASAKQTGTVEAAADTDAYTPMVAVKDAGEAKACVTLKAGQKGCTT